MYNSAFNDASLLQKLTYELDGVVLDDEDVLSTEIFWWRDRFSISGSIILKDNADVANLLPLNSENILQVYAQDGYDEFYFKKFILGDIEDTKYNEKFKGFKYTIVDRLSYTMLNTHQSKSYAGVLLSDIVEDFFGYFGWAELLDPSVALEILPTEKLHEFFVVPQNINFLEWLMIQMEKEGLTMYQTRKAVKIGVKKSDLLPAGLEKIEKNSYSQLHAGTEHPFKIHQHKTNFNPNISQSKMTPLQDTTHFDFATKVMVSTKSTFADVFDGYKIGTTELANIQTGIGEKLGTQTNDQTPMITHAMGRGVQATSTLDIIIVGNYMYNEIYKNVDVVLSGNLENLQGQKEGDIRMSGIYTITNIVDKMISGKLVQKLSLERANFQEAK